MLQPTELMIVICLCPTMLQVKEFDGGMQESATVLSRTYFNSVQVIVHYIYHELVLCTLLFSLFVLNLNN